MITNNMSLRKMIEFKPDDADMAMLPLDVVVYIKASIVSSRDTVMAELSPSVNAATTATLMAEAHLTMNDTITAKGRVTISAAKISIRVPKTITKLTSHPKSILVISTEGLTLPFHKRVRAVIKSSADRVKAKMDATTFINRGKGVRIMQLITGGQTINIPKVEKKDSKNPKLTAP